MSDILFRLKCLEYDNSWFLLSLVSQLVRQEEELRQEEEAYYEAKREAARAARAQKQKELNSRANAGVVNNGPNAWLGDENEWEV